MELTTIFSKQELRRLGKRFQKLDADNSGTLSIDELLALPGLQHNTLITRVVAVFDTNDDGEIDFQEFIQGISQFSVRSDITSKYKFAFKLYDIDRDGFISNGELFQVLKMMVGSNLKETQLQQIVDKTMLYADKDGDGKLNFMEFNNIISLTATFQKVTFSV